MQSSMCGALCRIVVSVSWHHVQETVNAVVIRPIWPRHRVGFLEHVMFCVHSDIKFPYLTVRPLHNGMTITVNSHGDRRLLYDKHCGIFTGTEGTAAETPSIQGRWGPASVSTIESRARMHQV